MVEMESAETERRPVRPTGGFTLVEMIVAISIAVVVMGGLLSVFIMSLRAWKEGSRDLSLQSSGRLIIEKIVRGPGGRFGLREAAENDVAADEDGKGIRFSVDKNNPPTYSKLDDTELRIYLEGNRIMYDPSTGVQGDEVPIVGFGPVKDVRFTVNEKAVTVELWMSDTSGSIHPSQVKVATTVFLRKSEDPDTQT
jgi:prepilin-type N-terminal cleavage/methylation domain-containing protein